MTVRPIVLVAVLAVGASCRDRDVVAEVGGTKVTRAELDAFVEVAGGRFAGDRAAALEALVERARLAEAARRASLADAPAVKGRLAASRREILANAYLDQQLEASMREDRLRQRYEAEKDKLARRRIHVAHIVARPSGTGNDKLEAARTRIIKAYARIADGEPFEKLAAELSEDTVTRARGGDLGPLLEGQVDPKFFEAAVALKAGEVSRPVGSPYAFHLIKALEDPDTVTPAFDEVRGRLAADARREAEQKLIEKLRVELTAEVHPDRIGPAVTATARP